MGVEAKRKAELVVAAIAEIGETGSLDVPVGRIARRAGVSPALAFHYFGDKDRLFLAAMRHVLTIYATEVRAALRAARTPRDRLRGVICASFSDMNFTPDVIAAWLNFYVLAARSAQARRLLSVYHRRLNANLIHDLRPLIGEAAGPAAARLGAVIDGLYLRSASNPGTLSGNQAITLALTALDHELRGPA